MKLNARIYLVMLALAFSALACQAAGLPGVGSQTPTTESAPPTPAPAVVVDTTAIVGDQLYKVTGSLKATNSVFADYYEEHAVMLYDMHGFVIRDQEWELPIASQVLGFIDIDEANLTGNYTLYLPLVPQGTFNDVDNNGKSDTGVQIFAVAYSPNLYGGPYAEGDDRSLGWPGYLASVLADSENQYEIIGGRLIIWAPDASQGFPTGFGPDGRLFTADDPTAPVPSGYSVVNLDTDPFTITQTTEADLPLIEPQDAAVKDFSALSYTEAFDKMFQFVSTNYAFNGIEGKAPNWDALYAELKPRVEEAEKAKNSMRFYQAIKTFTDAFQDGHVGLSGDLLIQDFWTTKSGGYGFTIRRLDDGSYIVNRVVAGGPAEKAGMKVGAVVTRFNGKPIAEAAAAVRPFFPESSEINLRYAQAIWLLRAEVGAQAEVTFTNPGGAEQTAKLKAVDEVDSLFEEMGWNTPDAILPVDSEVIERDGQEIGYIRINTNYDDLNLLIRLFERALKNFEEREVAGVIIDMRANGGGAPLGLAGFLTDQEIPTGQDEYYSDVTGQFEPEGLPGKIIPNQNQYRFSKLVLLVNRTCASACEFESYGFSQVPGMAVVGQYPTGGIFAEVSRGQIKLPAGLEMQIPTGRIRLPDGSIFLEGVGVVPTVRVPVTVETVLTDEDVVLDYGLRVILGEIKP
ncbi:MAG: S41 family peptidase [Anaerolineales bacterium]